jgi:hypothetical protein
MIAICEKRLKSKDDGPEAARLAKRIAELRERASDAPVPGPAPTHSSYITIIWHREARIRRRQQAAARSFLKAQRTLPGSVLERAVCVGDVGQ